MARRYGLHPSQVFAWRKQRGRGRLRSVPGGGSLACAFAPVVVTGDARLLPSGAIPHGRMEIVLLSGCRIVVDAGVDAAALDRVVTVLERPMIMLAAGTRIWLAAARTDMRKGFGGLSALVQQKPAQDRSEATCLCSAGGAATC